MPRYILSEKKKNLLVDDENYTYRRERDDAKKTKTYWKLKEEKLCCPKGRLIKIMMTELNI